MEASKWSRCLGFVFQVSRSGLLESCDLACFSCEIDSEDGRMNLYAGNITQQAACRCIQPQNDDGAVVAFSVEFYSMTTAFYTAVVEFFGWKP